MKECEICSCDHDTDAHGDPLASLQPSLHTMEEFASEVESTAESLVDYVIPQLSEEEQEDEENTDWRIEEAESAISDGGYIIVNDDDSWIIYNPVED